MRRIKRAGLQISKVWLSNGISIFVPGSLLAKMLMTFSSPCTRKVRPALVRLHDYYVRLGWRSRALQYVVRGAAKIARKQRSLAAAFFIKF